MQYFKKKLESGKQYRTTRRSILFAIGYSLMLSSTLFGCGTQTNTNPDQAASPNSTETPNATSTATNQKVLRIVRSKQLIALASLEKKGTLEKRLEPLGYKVEWPEFAARPQQLEALNAGGLDIASTAESPPIFSQAAGRPLVYLAANSSDVKQFSF